MPIMRWRNTRIQFPNEDDMFIFRWALHPQIVTPYLIGEDFWCQWLIKFVKMSHTIERPPETVEFFIKDQILLEATDSRTAIEYDTISRTASKQSWYTNYLRSTANEGIKYSDVT